MAEPTTKPDPREGERTIAYVLKGFPRISESFIASEIYRLEQLGLQVRIFVLKPADEIVRDGVAAQIRAKPDYLPPTTPLSGAQLRSWLRANLGNFVPALLRVSRRHPRGVAQAAIQAFAQAVRARDTFWSWPRKVYLKEFLLAAELSDRLPRAPDVCHLHAHFCHGATTVTWLASMITGFSFSFTAHAKDIYCESLNPAGLLRRKMDAARFVVTCTEANRKHLQQISTTQVHCIYHGLNADLSRLLDQQNSVTATNGELRVLGVGRLVPKKGFDVLVEACGILRQLNLPFKAVIVGESGEHEEEIKRLIRERALSANVRLAGPMPPLALYEEYRRATTFCLPCRVMENGDRDGIPNVLVEAMACRVPIVTTGISGIPEVVRDGVNGLLVPPDDPHALAGALLRLHRDRGLAQRLSRAAQATIRERFDGERFAKQLEALFREVLA